MKTRNNITTFLLLGIFIISLASASDFLPHERNTDLYFSFADTLAISCNVSTMDAPNETIQINQEMTTSGNTFYSSITKGNFTEDGDYCINIECINGYGNVCRHVTKTGTTLTIAETVIYVILAFGVFLLFGLSFYFLIATPYSNEVNEKNAVIQVTRLKYIKLSLILLTWVLFTWFLNILIGLSDNFVNLTMYYGFFGFIFGIMNRLSLPLGVVIIVIAFFEIVRDANIQGNIEKFGSALR